MINQTPASIETDTQKRSRQRGLTLIELMIGMSVVGILSGIAMPSFESQLHKSRRSDVLVATMTVQAAQERFRSNSNAYGSLAEVGVPNTSPAKHYTLAITENDAEGFALMAIAIGSQARDVACRHMKFTSNGMHLVYASGPSATVTNDATANQKCWSL